MALIVTACGGASPTAGGTAATGVTAGAANPGTSALRVEVEPQAGVGWLYSMILGAHHSIDLTMYELRDTTAEADLAQAEKRGVDVRVILDHNGEARRNAAAYSYLTSHGVQVHWANPIYTLTHQKTLTVDGTTSAIMTLNMVTTDYSSTRDFAVIDANKADVDAIVATFNADDANHSITPPTGSDLVWSPTNATPTMLSVIDGAKHTLAIESEEMDDYQVTDALEGAALRGVNVEVTMTANSEWVPEFDDLISSGAHVSLYPDTYTGLYIHAKVVIADAGLGDQRAFVGSENFSIASLDYNRELGVLTGNGSVISALNKVVVSDFHGGTTFRG